MSSELIPVTQMEIKHLSHFFEDLPLSSVQKNLTRTIFNKTDNVYNQNEDVEDFFQHNICEKDPPDENENKADDDSEVEEKPKDDKVATFESSSLGFSTNSFYKKKNEKKNHLQRKEEKKESISKHKTPIQFDKFDYYHFSSSKKYFNYKYPKLPSNDSSSFLTGMSANLEKRREKILRNTKGLEDCLFNHRERKEREDEESLLPPSSSLPSQSSRYSSHSHLPSSFLPPTALISSVIPPPLSSLPQSFLHHPSASNPPFPSPSSSPLPSSLLSPTTPLLRSRFRKEFVEKALTVQKKFIVHDDKKELISKNLKKLEILREILKSSHSGKLWVSPFKTFRGRDEKAANEEKVIANVKRRKPIEDGTRWRQEVDDKTSKREEGTALYGIKGKTMNTFLKGEINLNNRVAAKDNLNQNEKHMTLANLTKHESFKKKESSPFLKGKAFFSGNNQNTEIFNEYQNLISTSFQQTNFPIKKGRVSIAALFELYPFLVRMADNEKKKVFQAFDFEIKEREINITYENFVKFFKVLVKEEEGEECIVFWKKYFERKREDGIVENESKESYIYKKDMEDIICDFRREGFAIKKMDEMIKKIKFDEGKIKDCEFERWLRQNKYFTELMLCLIKQL